MGASLDLCPECRKDARKQDREELYSLFEMFKSGELIKKHDHPEKPCGYCVFNAYDCFKLEDFPECDGFYYDFKEE